MENLDTMSKKITNEDFIKMLYAIHGESIIAIDNYIGMNHKIRFQCSLGHIWFADPHNVLRGSACPYCNGKKAWIGFNDIWITNPDIACLLKNPEEGYLYMKASHVKVDFICPRCGSIINRSINDVYNRGFICPKCSDGISYPNKFARYFLNQLPIKNCIYEYHPDWAKSYFYDNYFEHNGKLYILEMDGGFHYKERKISKKSLKEIQDIDKIKTELAIKNGISVIRIDCRESNCDYIKNNILNSELSNIFDLSSIDWELCDKSAQKSLVKQACDLYMSGITKLNNIADILKVNKTTIIRYLKIGAKYEWCDYNVEKAIKEAKIHNSRTIQIDLIDNNNNITNHFDSIRECQVRMKEQYNIGISRKTIVKYCKNCETYNGLNFRFSN